MYNPARCGFGIRIYEERMTDENGAVVDVDRERDFVSDGDWAWSEIRPTTGNDSASSIKAPLDGIVRGLLAGFFR